MVSVFVEDFFDTIMSQLVLLVREVPLGLYLTQIEIIQLKKSFNNRLFFDLKPPINHKRLAWGVFYLSSILAPKSCQT